jgi:hypothetical protein
VVEELHDAERPRLEHLAPGRAAEPAQLAPSAAGSSAAAQATISASSTWRAAQSASKASMMRSLSAIGTDEPSPKPKRFSHTRSPQSRWFSVPWIERQKAPPSARRSASESLSAAP